MNFGKILKELRTEKNLSQQQQSILLGVSQSAIAKWELGNTEPIASAIVKVALFFDVSCDYLLGIKDEFDNNIACNSKSLR